MIATRASVDLRRIVELAAQGHSHRRIARRLGIDRETVARIVAAQVIAARTHVDIRHCSDGLLDQTPPGDFLTPQDDPPFFDAANLRRCRGCGSLVYIWPCLACCLAAEANAAAEAEAESDKPPSLSQE